jgi:hypothetical protein
MTERVGEDCPEIEFVGISGELEAIPAEDSSVGDIQGITTNHALAQIERSFQMREQVENKISLARIREYLIRFSEQKILLSKHLVKLQNQLPIKIRQEIETITTNSLSILRDFLTENVGNEVRVSAIMASFRNMLMEDLSPAIVFSKLNSIENMILKAELLRVQEEIKEKEEYSSIIDGKLHIDYVSGLPNKQAFIEDFHSLLLEQLDGKRIFSVLSLKLIDDPKYPEKTRFLPDDISLKSFKNFISLIQDFLRQNNNTDETSSLEELDIEMEPILEEENANDSFIETPIDSIIFENLEKTPGINFKERFENNRRLIEEMLMIFSTIGTENVGFTDLMAQESFEYKDALEEWQEPFNDFRIYRYGSENIMIILDGSISTNRERIFNLRKKLIDNPPLFDVNMSIAAFSDTSVKSISQYFKSKGGAQVIQESMDAVFSLLSMGQYYSEVFGKEPVNIAVNNTLCVFDNENISQVNSADNDGIFDLSKVVLLPEEEFRKKCARHNSEMFFNLYNAIRTGKLRRRR